MHGLPLISSPKRMLERLGHGAKAGEALEVLIPKQFQAFGEVLQGQSLGGRAQDVGGRFLLERLAR